MSLSAHVCVWWPISGILLHSIYSFSVALHVKLSRFDWSHFILPLVLWVFPSTIFGLSLTWAGKQQICLNKHKIFKKVLLGLWFFCEKKNAPFIPTLLLVKRPPSTDWWESIADVKCDNWKLAAGTYTHRTSPGSKNKWSYLKSNRKIILI